MSKRVSGSLIWAWGAPIRALLRKWPRPTRRKQTKRRRSR